MQEKELTIHEKGGRALRDSRPPGYFSKLVNARWAEYYKKHPEQLKLKRAKERKARTRARNITKRKGKA